MAIFKGAGVAIATPMKENLEVNYDKLDEMLEEQIAGGTDAIIICGTTGESATMTEEEHAATIRFAIERVNHRIPVIAGTGSNCTRTAIQLSKEAQEDGADGLLLVTPYYNKATQNGLIAHYTAICNEVNIPAILYNVPSRTGCGLQPQTVATLVKDVENSRCSRINCRKVCVLPGRIKADLLSIAVKSRCAGQWFLLGCGFRFRSRCVGGISRRSLIYSFIFRIRWDRKIIRCLGWCFSTLRRVRTGFVLYATASGQAATQENGTR